MRFKVDENLHPEIAELLQLHGHDAATVFDQGLRGYNDEQIAQACLAEGRVLLSLDLDFSNLLAFPPDLYPGLIVLRLRNRSRDAVKRVVGRVLGHLATRSIAGQLWVVDELRIRFVSVGKRDS
jgi:predicted nuclease of predicted toxin-antitoxin system